MWTWLGSQVAMQVFAGRYIGRQGSRPTKKKGEINMVTYKFRDVAVGDQPGNSYASHSTGTADGPDQGSATEINVRCNLKQPPLTTSSKGRKTPIYTISGINPSGKHEVLTATCTGNNDVHWTPDTVCSFRITD